MGLWVVAILVFVISLLFGYWRASVMRLSTRWFLALCLPLLAVVALGIFSVINLKLTNLLAVVVAYCLGQFVGGKLRHIIQGRGPGRSHG